MENSVRVLICCVNYHSKSSLENYLKSIERALAMTNDISLSVFIVDNSQPAELSGIFDYDFEISFTSNDQNYGYIKGIHQGLLKKGMNPEKYDFVIISNVDLELDASFFDELLKMQIDSSIGWVAPSIFSKYEGRDKNPQRLLRPSRRKLLQLKILFTFPLLHLVYFYFIYPNRKKALRKPYSGDIIYSGHGSLMIFTNQFISKIKYFEYPCFLFGEEIYFAELLRRYSLKTIYIPELLVSDNEHTSTGLLSLRRHCRYNRESLNYLIREFFSNEPSGKIE